MSLPAVFIRHIATAVPPLQLKQAEIAEQQIELWQLKDDEARRLRHLFSRTGIQTRHSAFEQWASDYEINALRKWLNTSITDKMQDYRVKARTLASEAAERTIALGNIDRNTIGAIVTVSCTGLYAPGLEFDLIEDLGLLRTVKRFPVNFIGCYAMFTALDLARNIAIGLTSTSNPHVLVVGVELCSLHYSADYSADAALAHALFADGAAACLVSAASHQDPDALEMDDLTSVVVPSEQDMAWHLGPSNFQMQLSAYVPSLLAPALSQVLPSPAAAHLYDYAIHPGGRRILEEVMTATGVNEDTLFASFQTMQQFGNMSSVTILFVLEALLRDFPQDRKPNQQIVAAGFGPGLTLMKLALSRVVMGR